MAAVRIYYKSFYCDIPLYDQQHLSLGAKFDKYTPLVFLYECTSQRCFKGNRSPSIKLSLLRRQQNCHYIFALKSSSNASCTLNPIPTWLVKSCLDVLAPPITHMINLSIRHAYVPDDWKTAIVKPLLKKSGLELTYKNFRSVGKLPFISKIVEKAVLFSIV